MRKQILKIFFSLAIFFMLPNFAHAREYWIDPLNGNDSWDGSQATRGSGLIGPKLNLNLLKNVLLPGDTVNLMDTTVYSGTQGFYGGYGFGVDGTQENPITIKAAPGAHPVFKGCGQSQVYFVIGHKWFIIDGLSFEMPDNPGDCAQPITWDIQITNNGSSLRGGNVVIKNCTTNGAPSGFVKISSADSNIVQNNTGANVGSAGSGEGAGEFVTIQGGKNNIIQGNTFSGAGHAAIGVYDYLNLTRLSSDNQILNNTIDQGISEGLNGGGGGIYVQVQSTYNLVDGNTVRNVGQMVGITQPKAGIDITASNNVISNNTIESYGVEGSELHKGIFLNSTSGYNNYHADNNLFENNFIGSGWGIPLYVREGIGTRASGVTVANNIFRSNTITTQKVALASGSYIGMYNPTGKYPIYLGSYQDGAWPVFANGNVFIDTNFIDDGSGLIGYFYASGGFAKTIAQTLVDHPTVFYASDSIAPAAPQGLAVL